MPAAVQKNTIKKPIRYRIRVSMNSAIRKKAISSRSTINCGDPVPIQVFLRTAIITTAVSAKTAMHNAPTVPEATSVSR